MVFEHDRSPQDFWHSYPTALISSANCNGHVAVDHSAGHLRQDQQGHVGREGGGGGSGRRFRLTTRKEDSWKDKTLVEHDHWDGQGVLIRDIQIL